MNFFDIQNIGKIYMPIDNSYILNLTDPTKEKLMHGKETIIVSMPYTCPIMFLGKIIKREFINVSYEGEFHRVMYFPHAIKH